MPKDGSDFTSAAKGVSVVTGLDSGKNSTVEPWTQLLGLQNMGGSVKFAAGNQSQAFCVSRTLASKRIHPGPLCGGCRHRVSITLAVLWWCRALSKTRVVGEGASFISLAAAAVRNHGSGLGLKRFGC